MKPISDTKMAVCRWAYVILLCAIVTVLIANDVFSARWMIWTFIVAGFLLGIAIEVFLNTKFPELFPKSDKEKAVEKMIQDIEDGTVDEEVDLPRTPGSTLWEILTVGVVAYAFYRAITLDQRLLPVIIFSVIALGLLFIAYMPSIKKKEVDASNMPAIRTLGYERRVFALFAATAGLMTTYFYYEDGYSLRWRPLILSIGLMYVVFFIIRILVSRRSASLMARLNNYNPADIRVVHTFEGALFEAVTMLMLIGAWCSAALNHQLAGKGILDIPVIDLIILSAFAVGLLILAYFPKWMRGAGTFKNDDQVLDHIRWHRIIAVASALTAMIITFIPNLDEKTLGYLYLAVLLIIVLGGRDTRNKEKNREISTTNNQ